MMMVEGGQTGSGLSLVFAPMERSGAVAASADPFAAAASGTGSPSRNAKSPTNKTSTSRSSSSRKRKISKSYIAKRPRKWVRRWVERKNLAGFTVRAMAWASDAKPTMSSVKEPPSIGRSFICQKCQKSFQDNSGLRKHMRIHGEKLFKCKWAGCEKRFIDNSKLKRHMLVHTGEKRFVCPYEDCNKRFSLDFNLKSHMKRHARDRKFPNSRRSRMGGKSKKKQKKAPVKKSSWNKKDKRAEADKPGGAASTEKPQPKKVAKSGVPMVPVSASAAPTASTVAPQSVVQLPKAGGDVFGVVVPSAPAAGVD